MDIKEINRYIKQQIADTLQEILYLINKYDDKKPGCLRTVYLFHVQLRCLLPKLFLYNEPFWQSMSWTKDILSYKFNKRSLPTINIEVINEQTSTIVDPHIEQPEPSDRTKRIEYFNQLKAKYGVNILKSLMDSYADESDVETQTLGSKYKSVNSNTYHEPIRQDELTSAFQICHQKKLYATMLTLFCTLICNREMCHLMFHESILNIMFNPDLYTEEISQDSVTTVVYNPFLSSENLAIIHKCMFYGFYILHKEECIIKASAKLYHRHILDLSSFSKIPNYIGDLETNPFIPLTLGSNYLQFQPDYIIKPIKNDESQYQRGLYSAVSFWKRFEIFTDGIFNEIAVDRVYFGGSVLSACAIRNPLEQLFGINLVKNDDLLFESIDLDPITNPNNESRINKLYDYWQTRRAALIDYFDEYYPSKNVTNFEISSGSGRTNVEEFLNLEDQLSDIDIKVDVVDDVSFDAIAFSIYDSIKTVLAKRVTKFSPYQIQLIKINTKKSYKYYISGTLLKRSVEIFRLFGIHPIGAVSRYHFPCVRGIAVPTSQAYGLLFGKVYLNPSCCSYANTGIYIDYKWMAHGNNPRELILKYFICGGTILLNAAEHAEMRKYIQQNPAWLILLKYHDNLLTWSINNPIFKPRMYEYGLFQKIIPYVVAKSGHYQYVVETLSDQSTDMTELRFPSGNIKPIYLHQLILFLR